MIIITRNLARQVRSVFRRALGANSARAAPPISIATGPDGLIIRAATNTCAIEYRATNDGPVERLVLPLTALVDFEGRRDDAVALERTDGGQIAAAWQDGDVPQIVQYDAPDTSPGEDWPDAPTELGEATPELLTSLRDAMDTADKEAVRYATNTIQLCGDTGRIIATDGRQLLIQGDFTFPWSGQVLVPRNTALAAKELRSGEARIGKSDDWVTLVSGSWTLHLAVQKDVRFPDVDRHVPASAVAQSSLVISDRDADFLGRTLKRLPGGEDINKPVTVDLNGTVTIRAKSESQPSATEVLLTNSRAAGVPVRFNSSRSYLARAVQLGFRRLHVTQPELPVFCEDDRRSYVWAVLTADDAIKPDPNAVRVKSPRDDKPPPNEPAITPKQEEPPTMPRNRINDKIAPSSNGAADHNGAAQESQGVDALIDQAEGLKRTLRDAASQATDLIAALKRERKQSRAIRSTLASLRQLQTLDV